MEDVEEDKSRIRVSRACEGCKASRRKCSGELPCEHCVKRGIECVVDDNPPKKRGPKTTKTTKLQAENERLRAELDKLREAVEKSGVSSASLPSLPAAAKPSARGSAGRSNGGGYAAPKPAKGGRKKSAAPASRSQTPSPTAAAAGLAQLAAAAIGTDDDCDGLLPCGCVPGNCHCAFSEPAVQDGLNAAHGSSAPNIWAAPGPIVATPEELSKLETYFAYANLILPAVNRTKFYDALVRAQSYSGSAAVANGRGRASGTKRKASEFTMEEAPPMDPVERSEAFGFRVLFYTILCAGAKLQRRFAEGKRYYELARAYAGACFAYPSEFLCSALLVMAMLTRSMCEHVQQAACHAALAIRMTELVPVSPEPRMVAVILNNACGAGGPDSVPLPPAVAPPEQAAEARFGDILCFTSSQLMHDFEGVDRTGESARLAFSALLDEAMDLSKQLHVDEGFPLRVIVLGIHSILKFKSGAVASALDLARQCLDAAAADSHISGMCFPCVGTILRLKGVLRDPALARGDLGAATAQKSRDLSAGAYNFLRDSTSSMCPRAAAAVAESGGCAEVVNAASADKNESGEPDMPPCASTTGVITGRRAATFAMIVAMGGGVGMCSKNGGPMKQGQPGEVGLIPQSLAAQIVPHLPKLCAPENSGALPLSQFSTTSGSPRSVNTQGKSDGNAPDGMMQLDAMGTASFDSKNPALAVAQELREHGFVPHIIPALDRQGSYGSTASYGGAGVPGSYVAGMSLAGGGLVLPGLPRYVSFEGMQLDDKVSPAPSQGATVVFPGAPKAVRGFSAAASAVADVHLPSRGSVAESAATEDCRSTVSLSSSGRQHESAGSASSTAGSARTSTPVLADERGYAQGSAGYKLSQSAGTAFSSGMRAGAATSLLKSPVYNDSAVARLPVPGLQKVAGDGKGVVDDSEWNALMAGAFGDLTAEFDRGDVAPLIPFDAAGTPRFDSASHTGLPSQYNPFSTSPTGRSQSHVKRVDGGGYDTDDDAASVTSLGLRLDGILAGFPFPLEALRTAPDSAF